ncbi:PIN domain-like protein, partial [Gloeophyllum trabeum ATCC 11539]
MGVPGLWEVIQPVGQSRSLMNIAVVDGFERNTSGRRAYRVGIDTSIWFTHSYYSKGGENPQLRLLFFRLAKLAELPLLPLFVFDGRERPKVKRGSRMGKSGSHGLTDAFKQMLGHFGFEWRVAYGEAEAELARLNQIGIIDAILTDDVDTFIFGARVVIKNWSKELSGNKSKPATDADGKVSKHHVMVFNADDIRTHPSIGLTRGGLILFALLKGGDYDVGVPGIGEKIAHGLARAGFGDQLLTAFERRAQQPIQPFLAQWRADITTELRTNSRGLLPHRCTSVTIPVSFPDLQVLENYAAPRISPQGGGPLRDRSSLHVPRIARFCEDSFEWGYRSKILYRLRSVLWEACVMRVLRRAALEADEKEKTRRIAAGGEPGQAIRGALTPAREDTERRRAAFPGSSGLAAAQNTARAAPVPTVPKDDPLLVEIVSTRQHASTDRLLEYHVVLKPGPLVALANSGITGKRPEPSDAQKGKEHEVDPLGETRMWVPAPMMRQVHPDLVEDYETSLREKGNKR